MIVDIVDKYFTDDNNPIKNLRLKKFGKQPRETKCRPRMREIKKYHKGKDENNFNGKRSCKERAKRTRKIENLNSLS